MKTSVDDVLAPDRRDRPARVAIVGSGVSGLSAAWHIGRLGGRPVVFEAEPRAGGHAHTVTVALPDADGLERAHGVDVGFLVYNQRTYPGLIGWFLELGVDAAASDMSFSVQSPALHGGASRLEWSGSDLNTVFAQRRNLASPPFWSMLAQVLRFNRLGTAWARGTSEGAVVGHEQTVGAFLEKHGFDRHFRDGYLLPMIACIWSCPVEQMLEFPVATLLRFCDNHGLLQVRNRPPWFTVRGGSRCYVDAAVARLPDVRLATPVRCVRRGGEGVTVETDAAVETFDAVVIACHAPQALALLGEGADVRDRAVLAAMRTQRNVAVLHTDTTLMPTRRRAWAAWNFERAQPPGHGLGGDARSGDAKPVCLHYWINRLQPLPFARDVFVSLNPCREPAASTVLGRWEVDHPVLDLAAWRAQARLPAIQGLGRVWFAGAWCGYGFHEDGFQAGLRAAQDVMAQLRPGAVGDGPVDTRKTRLDPVHPWSALASRTLASAPEGESKPGGSA